MAVHRINRAQPAAQPTLSDDVDGDETPTSADAFEYALHRPDNGPSYAQLAGQRLPPLWAKVGSLIGTVNPQSMPHDDAVYALRKHILKLRDQLDIFAHAYSDNEKSYRALRTLLDDGYEALGSFKDLFSGASEADSQRNPVTGAFLDKTYDPSTTPYDAAFVKERLKMVLAWQTTFSKAFAAGRFAALLRSPSDGKLKHEPKSNYYWGAQGIRPKNKLSGNENLRRLVRSMLDATHKHYGKTKALEGIHEHENELVFHGFRKRVRALLTVLGSNPELLKASPLTERALAVLEMCKAQYGEVGNCIIAHQLAKRRGDKAGAKTIARDLERRWQGVQAWQEASQVSLQLFLLERSLDP